MRDWLGFHDRYDKYWIEGLTWNWMSDYLQHNVKWACSEEVPDPVDLQGNSKNFLLVSKLNIDIINRSEFRVLPLNTWVIHCIWTSAHLRLNLLSRLQTVLPLLQCGFWQHEYVRCPHYLKLLSSRLVRVRPDIGFLCPKTDHGQLEGILDHLHFFLMRAIVRIEIDSVTEHKLVM